jgi:DNA polymerase-3 subunit beta
MKINININELKNLIKDFNQIININKENLILNNILLKANDNQIEIIGANDQIALKKLINIQIIENGEILIPYKTFYGIVSKINDKDINIETIDNKTLLLTTPNFKCQLNLVDKDSFPSYNFVYEGYSSICLLATSFQYVLNTVAKCASNIDNSRKVLEGILIDSTRINNKLEFASTNTIQLGYHTYDFDGAKAKLIIDPKVIKLLNLIDTDKNINLYFNNQRLYIETNSTTIYATNLIEGEYPNISNLINGFKDQYFNVLIDKEYFTNSIEKTLLINEDNDTVSGNVKLIMSNDNMLVVATANVKGTLSESIEIKSNIENTQTVNFNTSYLLNILKTINCEKILLQFNDQCRFVYFSDPKNPDTISLLTTITN